LKHYNADEVHNLLDYAGLVGALRDLFITGVDFFDRMAYTQTNKDNSENHWILLPAWQHGNVYGIKLVSVFPQNQEQGLESIQGIYVLFDGTNGLPIATMDGAALTLRKTAANSALAATYLARDDASTMLMVGAGALAPHLIEAHCTVRPIKRVRVWNRTIDRAAKVVQSLSEKLKVDIEMTTDLEKSVRESHLISCATMSSAPLISGTWLAEGTHLDLVGGYQPEMREADDEAIKRSRVFVDAPSTIEVCGDICQPLNSGLLALTDIGDTFQLARGEKPGRQSPTEITLFKSGGGGHEDLGTAKYLLTKANAQTI
jgi:ornithine cyclodeaminase